MKSFRLVRPATFEEAFDLYDQAAGRAAYLAGGTDLLVRYKKREIAPELVVSLNALPGLDRVEEQADEVVIGGLATLRQLEVSPIIQSCFPVLFDALSSMASVQIRNVATMAGNIVNAASSADTAPPLLALGAELVLAGRAGRREARLEEFFLGPGRAATRPGEILIAFRLPKPKGLAGGAYAKVSRRRAMDLALLGVAVQLELAEDKITCRAARIGLGVAAPTPIRARRAEEFLTGREATEENLAQAGRIASEEASPRDSVRCQAWYRREMIRVYTRRMGLKALERAVPEV